MSVLQRDGTKIQYEVHGEGPCVLLTHGYAASARMWDAQRVALSAEYRPVLWNMRGHGESDAPGDVSAYSAEATVADMAAILDACGEAQAVIAGMSLGGYMSLDFHRAHPARVRALVLVDTGPGFRNADARTAWNGYALATAERYARDGLRALPSSPEVASASHRSARGLELAARGMLVQHDARVIESLRRIVVPTLIVVGAEDKLFLDAADYMARVIPGAIKRVIAKAGHAPNVERPEAFNDVLLDFLKSLS
ncbi:MAG: alpha/beta fold hydrolase [Deltaproteobacteria bacterium]|nr:alpha/beta fold hydrolase [Deltaproteobacteria bacterium]